MTKVSKATAAGLIGACALVLAVPAGAGAVTQIKTFDGAAQIFGCRVDSIGVELLAETIRNGELLDTGSGDVVAEGPISYERDTFTATNWQLFDETGTASWQVVVGKKARQYFVTDPAATSGKYKMREYEAAGTLVYKGATYAMEGCRVVVYP